MWIVKYGDNTRHSAWVTKSEALNQAEVLSDYGYIMPNHRCNEGLILFIEFDSTVQCENGHYYV